MATQAQITINAVAGSNDDLPLGTLVTLSNNGLGGETTYLWSILSQPEGPADVLSSTTILSPTFTPTKEGSYLIRLIVNFGQPSEQTDLVIAAVRELETRERIPAAGETTENNPTTGWANTAVDRVLQRVTRLEDSGYFVGVTGAAGMVAGNVVWIDDTTTIATGLPDQRTVPVVDLAPANVLTAIQNDVAILVGGVDGSPTPASGDLVRVLSAGLFLGVPYVGPAPAVGDPVYVSDTATLALTAGTYPRVVGNVARAGGGTFDVWFDSSADVTSVLGPAGGVLGYPGSTYPDPNGLAGGDGTWAPAGRIPIAAPSGTEIQFRVDPRPTAGSGIAGAHLYQRAGLGAAASAGVPGAVGGDAALFGANGSAASATQSGGDGGSAGVLGGNCKDGGIGGGAFALAGYGGDGEPGGAFGPGAGGDVGISGGKGGESTVSGTPAGAGGQVTVLGGEGGDLGGDGGNITLAAGTGTADDGSGVSAAGLGGNVLIGAGVGGAADAANGGLGGLASLTGGTGGAASSTNDGGNGGGIIIEGGTGGAGTGTNEPGDGGQLNLLGGDAGTAAKTSGGARGGDVLIEAGQSRGTFDGADVLVRSGIAGSSGGDGGDIDLLSRDGDDANALYAGGAGGAITLTAGQGGDADAAQNAGAAGAVAVTAGKGGNAASPTLGSIGGAVLLTGGEGGDGDGAIAARPGGAVALIGGAGGLPDAGAGAAGGGVVVSGGTGSGAAAGGAAAIGGGTGGGSNGQGGTVGVVGGSGGGVNGAGGAAGVSGGAGVGVGNGGITSIIGGAAAGTGNGGNVSVQGGSSSGGTQGAVNIGTSVGSAVTAGRSGIDVITSGRNVKTPTTYAPLAATTIPVNGPTIFLNPAANRDMTASPTLQTSGIAAGTIVTLVNEDTTFYVDLTQDAGGTSFLKLATGNIYLFKYDAITFIFDGTYWVEVGRNVQPGKSYTPVAGTTIPYLCPTLLLDNAGAVALGNANVTIQSTGINAGSRVSFIQRGAGSTQFARGGSSLIKLSNPTITLDQFDVVEFVFDGTFWCEASRSSNA